MADPLTFDAHLSLGRELLAEGRPAEAAVPLAEAVRLRPADTVAWHALGLARHRCSDPAAAADAFRAAIAADPAAAASLVNLGTALYELGRPAEAVPHLRRAVAIRPDLPGGRYNLALCLLALGDWEHGWPLLEHRRGILADPVAGRPLPPVWDGRGDLAGRTVLAVCEGGLGNAIQFVRYAAVLAGRAGPGGRVVVLCPRPLRALFATVPGVARTAGYDDPVPAADRHVRLMSCPALFGTRPQTAPRSVPYLRPDPAKVAEWAPRLAGPGLRVGVAWQGDRRFGTDRQRSVPLVAFEPLAAVPGVRLFSLQKGYGIDQLPAARRRFPVQTFDAPPLDADPAAGAFADTAAVMANVDLVVTSDTSIAHLAGALGVRTWVALDVGCDWRWMRDRPDTPWYPTMRLFRQAAPGDWLGVFARMADALRQGLRPTPTPAVWRPPLLVPASPGELLDRLTILQIKAERLTDPAKLPPIRAELAALADVRRRSLPHTPELDALARDLRQVNEALWQIEDDLRAADAAGDFGPRFVYLARRVYRTNDRRSALKRRANVLLGSAFRDEKQYPPYPP